MSLESDLFERLRPDTAKLAAYGFENNGNTYVLERMIVNGTMRARIEVTPPSAISGKVFDDFDEEYIAFRLDGARGEFAANVRREYLQLLEEIAANCFHTVMFVHDQTNRIADHILAEYQDEPEHLFEKFPGYAVFRHENSKWYGIIMEVHPGQLENLEENKEIINLKVPPEKLSSYLEINGIYPAFHMNRKNWISAVLDDTLEDSVLFELIRQSRQLTSGHKTDVIRSEWIIPSNPKYFDLDHAFSVSELLYWKQSSKVKKGDLVYIYSGMPYGEIRWVCEAVETDLPYNGPNDGPVHFEKLMRLKKLYFFDHHLLNRKMIARYGVTNIRGPRYMPKELKEEINRLYQLEEIIHE